MFVTVRSLPGGHGLPWAPLLLSGQGQRWGWGHTILSGPSQGFHDLPLGSVVNCELSQVRSRGSVGLGPRLRPLGFQFGQAGLEPRPF